MKLYFIPLLMGVGSILMFLELIFHLHPVFYGVGAFLALGPIVGVAVYACMDIGTKVLDALDKILDDKE